MMKVMNSFPRKMNMYTYTFGFFLFLFLFVAFSGMAIIKKIIQVSGAQFYNMSSLHCIVCSPSQVKSLPITIYTPYFLLHLSHPQQYLYKHRQNYFKNIYGKTNDYS